MGLKVEKKSCVLKGTKKYVFLLRKKKKLIDTLLGMLKKIVILH